MTTSASHPQEQDKNRRLLLVQCCHLPQFFYMAAALRRQFPNTPLDALVIRSDDLDFYLSRQNPFSSVLTPSSPSFQGTDYSRIFFPLFNRGYRSIKSAARRLSGSAFEVDYQGRARPLSGGRLALSILYPLHQPDQAFREYLLSFPHRPLGEKVLFVESCHPSLLKATESVWRAALPNSCELTRLAPRSLLKALRQLRGRSFDSSIVFSSGEQGYWGIKLVPFLLRVPKTLVINESGDFFYATLPGLLRFLYQRVRFGSALPRPISRILFLQTEDFASCHRALTSLKSGQLFPDSEIVVLCREENSSGYRSVAGVDRVLELRKGAWLHNWRTFWRLRLLDPDIVSAVFSGRPVFLKAKLFFLFFCDRPGLVFNAAVECYFLSLRTFPRLLAREPLRFGTSANLARARPILVVQTEHSGMTRESIRRLASPKLYPGARLMIVCRAESSSPLEDFPGVERIVHYPRRLSDWFRLARQLRSARPCLVSLILSGRRVFSLHKFFVLALFPFRPKLAFNAQLDAYWLRPTTLLRIFRREPLLLEEPGGEIRNEILLIQTDSTDATLRALEHLQSGQAVGRGKVRLLCREEDRQHFLPRLEESDISTWTPGISAHNLKQMIKVGRIDRDVVTAIFSGRAIFRLQKLAFFLLPARNRLVFNENMDCFYLTRSRFGSVLRLPSLPVSLQESSEGWKYLLRQAAKIVLFLPRFGYLLGWLSVEKLKRARRLQETGPTRLNRQP